MCSAKAYLLDGVAEAQGVVTAEVLVATEAALAEVLAVAAKVMVILVKMRLWQWQSRLFI